jgi:heat shock protein HtpX
MKVSRFFTHRLANLFETAIIMAASFCLMLFIAWLFAGTTGIVLICVAGVPALLFGGAQAGRLVLRMYRAVPLTYRSSPDLTELVEELARRAKLAETPQLFYIPSSAPLAFSVGLGRCGAIALSDGILRLLSWREITGVVAHEVSHIAGNDTRVMGVADVASRLVSTVSFAGQMLIIFNLPLYLLSDVSMPWIPLFAMIFAPLLMTLLQLALSRSREYEADLTASQLTGDPLGLASALERMELSQNQQLRRLFLPYGKIEAPSILRTHPGTAKRIKRLVDLAHELGHIPADKHTPVKNSTRQILLGVNAPARQPRRRFSGIWY